LSSSPFSYPNIIIKASRRIDTDENNEFCTIYSPILL
jgi:hypothetical protein